MAVINPVMTTVLREMIGDTDSSNYTYTDARLEVLLTVSAYQVNQELDFTTSYTVDVAATGITPDPVAQNDHNFISLTTLKAACTSDMAEFRDKAKCASKVSDGLSSIDTTKQAEGYDKYNKSPNSNCSLYEETKLQYEAGNLGVGHVILGPYSQDLGGRLI